ncbi:MAG: YggS family pyridoxal phosphate-dependent enzyme [Ruminococcus sp.]|nr:YggS family pyridoxal phosphate-dependent enzyme [Ruminococcus sp.]
MTEVENNFSYIDENLRIIHERIEEAKAVYRRADDDVRIMAVTKTVSPEAVNHAVSLGIDLLGENRVQEYLSKKDVYDKSAEVQFIGSLQTNKVKYIIDSVSLIQSVDSLRLAETIDLHAHRQNKIMDILCEVNIGGEDSKGGVSPDMVGDFIEQISQFENIRVRGLMTIPPPSDSDIFLGRMQELFNRLSDEKKNIVSMDILSMGMTHDYAEAVKFGSTLVRIGTGLFGARDYSRK